MDPESPNRQPEVVSYFSTKQLLAVLMAWLILLDTMEIVIIATSVFENATPGIAMTEHYNNQP